MTRDEQIHKTRENVLYDTMQKRKHDDIGSEEETSQPPAKTARKDVILKEIVSDGDLEVSFSGFTNDQGRVTALLVSREMICRGSLVFKSMVADGSPWLENQQPAGRCQRVDLADDDPDVMEIVMNVLHYKRREVPLKVSFDTLESLAILCDKYDLLEALGVWPEMWARSHIACIEHPDKVTWLFIASTFKFTGPLSRVLQFIVINAITSDGRLVSSTYQDFSEGVLDSILGKPHQEALQRIPTTNNIPDHITQIRSQALLAIETFIKSEREQRQLGTGLYCLQRELSRPNQTREPDFCSLCFNLNYGILTTAFPECFDSQVYSSGLQNHSIAGLLQYACTMTIIQNANDLSAEFLDLHGGCDVGLRLSATIAKIYESARLQVAERVKTHDLFRDGGWQQIESLTALIPSPAPTPCLKRVRGRSYVSWGAEEPMLIDETPHIFGLPTQMYHLVQQPRSAVDDFFDANPPGTRFLMGYD